MVIWVVKFSREGFDIDFEDIDIYLKIDLILYLTLENSTTHITIFHSNGHDNDRLSRLPILASPGTMKFSSTLFQATLVLGITVILLLPPQAQVSI